MARVPDHFLHTDIYKAGYDYSSSPMPLTERDRK